MAKTSILTCMFKRSRLFLGSTTMSAIFTLLLTIHPVMANEPDPSFTLKIEGSRVQLTADGAPLNKILESLSSQSGIKLKSTDQATELVYCHLTNEPLVETLKKLLRNWSFTFIYKSDNNEATLPDTLWIIKKNPRANTTDPIHLASMEAPALPRQDHQKRFEKTALTKVFADSQKVLASFSAKNNATEAQSKGMRIITLSPDAPFREMGLKEEDLIVNVNGQPVATAIEFVQALTSATKNGPPIIRIDRRHNGMVDPIYLEIH